jgi:hypothetical protein
MASSPAHHPAARTLLRALALGLIATLAAAWLAPGALHGVLPIRWHLGVVVSDPHAPSMRHASTLVRDYVSLHIPGPDGPFTNGVANPPPWTYLPESWDGIDKADSLAAGFPFRAFTGHSTFVMAPDRGHFDLAALSGAIEPSPTSDRWGIIPLRPLWSGLIADIAIWTAVCALAAAAISHIRRWLRARRAGRCANCGYDLTATPPDRPCPECGTPAASTRPPRPSR